MELKAAIYYRNAYAHYKVIREQKRIYFAELVHYDGQEGDTPPANILLVRGIRQWWGSTDNAELVRELGNYISTLSESMLFFNRGNNAADKIDETT